MSALRGPNLWPAIGGLVALLAATAVGVPREARADGRGRITLRARLEPADLGPGGKGMLVVAAELGNLMVFADGEAALTWRSVPSAGVTYGTPETPVAYANKPSGVEMTAPATPKDATEEPFLVWESTFELRVPVEIARDADPASKLALLLDYTGCDPEMCYARQKDHRASATLGAPPEPVVAEPATEAAALPEPAFPVVPAAPLETTAAPLAWTRVDTVERLRQEVDSAKEAGRPVVVALTATWCSYCKKYEALIDGELDLREGFARLVRLQFDVTADPRSDLRAAVGFGSGQPRMAFLDRQGRILRSLDVDRWYGDAEATALELRRRLLRVLAGS